MKSNIVQHITKLLLNNDCVIVPGFGGFMAHHTEAHFNGEEGRFYPPRRTVGFNQQLTMNDSLLVQSYIEIYDMSYPEALNSIEEEVSAIKQTIEAAGKYTFTGLGTITVDENGKYDFTPCHSGILTPTLFALDPIEATRVSTTDNKNEGGTISCNTQTQQSTHTVKHPSPTDNHDMESDNSHIGKRNTISLHTLRNLAAACVIIVAFILMPKPTVLENEQPATAKIDTGLLLRMMPKDVTTGQPTDTAIKVMAKTIADKKKPGSNRLPDTSATVKQELDGKAHFTIVLASKVSRKGAEMFVSQLKAECRAKAAISNGRNDVMVTYGHFSNFQEANKERRRLTDDIELADSWILQLK